MLSFLELRVFKISDHVGADSGNFRRNKPELNSVLMRLYTEAPRAPHPCVFCKSLP